MAERQSARSVDRYPAQVLPRSHGQGLIGRPLFVGNFLEDLRHPRGITAAVKPLFRGLRVAVE